MMMDRNNPALPKTQSLVYLFYKYSFVENNKGYGAAIVMLLLLIILLLTGAQQMIQKRWVHYS
jgi:multiple sugar transport system permease protein